MRIAFIPTAYRTPFFHGVAERLAARGHEPFWLSPNRRWARWLRRAGTASDRVFDLTSWAPEWSERTATSDDLAELSRLETSGDLGLLNLILMNPLLRRRPTPRALRYLAVARRSVAGFLESHGIEVVFGEQTWAFELLVGQVCRSLGIPHLMPHTVRIPGG